MFGEIQQLDGDIAPLPYVSILPSLAPANPPQRVPSALQTSLRPDTSRFYLRPGFGDLVPLNYVSQAWAPQTHFKHTSKASQTPLRPETSRFYIGPGFGSLAPFSLLSTLVQIHPKRTSNASQTCDLYILYRARVWFLSAV